MPDVESLAGRTFREQSLRGSRFDDCDFTDVVVRGSDVTRLEVDSAWLMEPGSSLIVNGVDVVPFVDAELDRRFPGRSLRQASDPAGLRAAWAAVVSAWESLLVRVESMPAGTADASVAAEWSVSQTLRHLVMATDTWLGVAVLRLEKPYHPAGLPHDGPGSAAYDASTFDPQPLAFTEVLTVRAGRQAMVTRYLSEVTGETLAEARANPHDPAYAETVLSCLHTILHEEWEHLRFVTRDLDTIENAEA